MAGLRKMPEGGQEPTKLRTTSISLSKKKKKNNAERGGRGLGQRGGEEEGIIFQGTSITAKENPSRLGTTV